MRNKWKKLLAALLCVAMVLALAPVNVFAETAQNNGEQPDGIAAETDAFEDAEKTVPVFTCENTDPEPVRKDTLCTETVSAQNSKQPASDKPDGSVMLTDPAKKKDGEMPESNTEKGNVYSGTMNLGWTSFTINANDTTFYQFVPEQTGTYRFYTIVTDDTYGYLQDANKSALTSNDDGGYGTNFMISYNLTAGQTYYVGARYYDTTKTGTIYVFAELMTDNGSTLFSLLNNIEISKPGETVYLTFTPSVSGSYKIYSLSTIDTFVRLADSAKCVYATDDDTGYNTQFELSISLNAGQTYYVGVSYYSSTQTGSIPVMIEQQDVDSVNALGLGINWVSVSSEGTTCYRSFTVPKTGYYWIYTTASYTNDATKNLDTFGCAADSSMKVFSVNDDGGFGMNCRISLYLTKDEVYYFGARYYSGTTTGSFPLMIEYPYVQSNAFVVGDNAQSVTDPGSISYYPFTPTESGTYRVESTASQDMFCVLADANRRAILYDDDSGDGNNFRFSYEMNAGETYYIGPRFYGGNMTGDYTVRITKTASSLPAFDGKIEWNASDVQFKGTTPYVVYHGAAFTPRFTVKDKNGNVIAPSHYTYEYRENVNAGTGYVIVTFNDLYAGTARGWFKIYLPPTSETTVSNVSNGIQITWQPVTGAAGYVVYRRAWSSTTNGWTTFERWNNTTALSFTDITVYAGTRYQYGVKAYFAQRVDPVTGATIGGNVGDNFNLGVVGPLKTTVRITTRKLSKLAAGSGRITAYWDASKVFTGYQIKYATDAAFTKNVKSVWISDPSTASKAVTGLTNGTTYYFCVRSYHNFEGTNYYGQWSNVLSVKPGSGQIATCEKYRAVVVGETAYTSASVLPGCVNDADAITGMLKGFPTPYSVTELKNGTKSQIISAIRTMCSATKEGDVSLFSFSGHGLMVVDSNGDPVYSSSLFGALSTVDGQRIPFDELAEELSKAKGRVIVLLDSCHSGTAISKSADGTSELDAFNAAAIQAFAAYDTSTEKVGGQLKNNKFVVIAAASYTQSSYDGYYDGSGYAQGAFSAAIVKGLGAKYPNGARNGSTMPADKNSNKQVTLKELYDYTYQTAYNWTSGSGNPQRAQYYGTTTEVLFRR